MTDHKEMREVLQKLDDAYQWQCPEDQGKAFDQIWVKYGDDIKRAVLQPQEMKNNDQTQVEKVARAICVADKEMARDKDDPFYLRAAKAAIAAMSPASEGDDFKPTWPDGKPMCEVCRLQNNCRPQDCYCANLAAMSTPIKREIVISVGELIHAMDSLQVDIPENWGQLANYNRDIAVMLSQGYRITNGGV